MTSSHFSDVYVYNPPPPPPTSPHIVIRSLLHSLAVLPLHSHTPLLPSLPPPPSPGVPCESIDFTLRVYFIVLFQDLSHSFLDLILIQVDRKSCCNDRRQSHEGDSCYFRRVSSDGSPPTDRRGWTQRLNP